jgi:hypothetical protein
VAALLDLKAEELTEAELDDLARLIADARGKGH